ncbi:phage tail tip fiber protein [Aeromonas hydrophila]|uniref:phage tail tip fiber protein n=1 Tax=Aeromonas hydrophila TaxID=644 RepID=UPI003F68032F
MAKPAYRAGRDPAATAENVELLTGQRGNKLDKAVTLRELTELGLATLRPGAGGAYNPGKNPDLFPTGIYDKPHAPVNVQANGAFHTVVVEWDSPNYRGHAHTEIWRAETDSLPAATLVGTTSANVFSDAIGKGAQFYYWARFVNGKDDAGPFNANGVMAETSRDVQDILDELQGKIEDSHLAKELLAPIKQVPQLTLDVEAIRPRLEEIDVSIGTIQNKIPSIEGDLASLSQKQQESEDLLKDAQAQLGNASIDIGLVQDRLNNKIDKYKGDFDSFRDAAFKVDPENGSITMDAVNAVREEMRTSITEVHQGLDAVSGQIASKADNVTVYGQGKRITEAEQRINGLDASLSQTVTKGEFTDEQKKVTQIGQELNATKGELAQKATQQQVDEQGERLANAESKLTVHTDELSSQAQRIDGLQATVNSGDEVLDARITELARVTAEADGVTAKRVSGLEVRAGEAEGKISALEEVIESNGGITAGRFDEIKAEVELAKDKANGAGDAGQAAIDAALAGDERDRGNRKSFGAIRTQQQVIVNEQAAQAKRITDMDVKFEGKDADTQARITGVEEVFADAGSALAQRIDDMSASTSVALGETAAAIKALEQVSTDADSALALRQDQMHAELTDADNTLSAGIASESEARTTAIDAMSRRVDELTASMDGELGDLKARAAQEEQARADGDGALAQRMTTLDASVKEGDATNAASISSLEKVVVDTAQALAQRQDNMESSIDLGGKTDVEGALASDERDRENRKALGKVITQQQTLANTHEALARDVTQLTADYKADSADLHSQVTEERLVRSTAVDALAQKTSVLEAQIEGVDQSLSASIAEVAKANADANSAMTEKLSQQQSAMETADAALSGRINEEATTRADAVELLANQIQQVTANYQDGDNRLEGQITAESEARANAVQSLASQINTVSAVAGSKNKTFFQATAPGTGMGTGDLWFDTANNNRPYRYSGTAWVATDDPRIAANAAAVQQQSKAIADLQNGAQAMWTAKASAGQITAGIGLIAKSDGTSQVALSASQVFVFDPNSSTPMAPLFAIDNGQAVIAEAIIRKATIQILTSEKITADYIKAGVSISSPLINGGQIDMGNAFMAGGAAGFGKGGPYGGWGWGWHTIIYADGSIYTDRLYASNGTFTGTVNANNGVLNNVTINENCTISGTLDADRIVGDVTALIKPSGNFSVVAYKRARNMVCVKPIAGNAVISGSGLIGIYLICKMNGVEQGRALYQSNYPTGINRIPMRVTLQEAFVIPANVNATISFEIVPYGNVSSISEQYVESGSVWLMSLF